MGIVSKLVPLITPKNTAGVLARACALILLIALLDWRFEENLSFGFLYLFPMLMVGSRLSRIQIALFAALCTALGEMFDPFVWSTAVGFPRLILIFAAYLGAGLFVYESARSKRLSRLHLERIEHEAERRREAEEQLQVLISSSPASIFTLDSKGLVLLANDSAHRLFGVETGGLQDQPIGRFLPALADMPAAPTGSSFFRTAMECRGQRQDGEVFLARVWFSTYRTSTGPRLAAVVFDGSEELREREESGLQQLLTGSKLLVGALCHEIRNVCGAIGVVHAKVARDRDFSSNDDFRALGTLVAGLEKMAGLELRQTARSARERIDLRALLDELRIVIEPSFQEAGLSTQWSIPLGLPRVIGDRQALLQCFLNIAKNSLRALENIEYGELKICAAAEQHAVHVRFSDNGPGVADPAALFQPFQVGAQASGLGLYLSRALVRAFGGDIEYEPQAAGACFRVSLESSRPAIQIARSA